MLFRRGLITATATVAIGLLGAGPALAHYCSKSGWNENAHANAQKSQAWITADEWKGFVPFFIECSEGQQIVFDAIDAQPADTLFMGPGLLAGGTSPFGPANGKGKNPEQFNYLLEPIIQAFEACGVDPFEDEH